jgi:hypothetical protein
MFLYAVVSPLPEIVEHGANLAEALSPPRDGPQLSHRAFLVRTAEHSRTEHPFLRSSVVSTSSSEKKSTHLPDGVPWFPAAVLVKVRHDSGVRTG